MPLVPLGSVGHLGHIFSLIQVRERVEKDPPCWASILGMYTKRNLKPYPWQKQVY